MGLINGSDKGTPKGDMDTSAVAQAKSKEIVDNKRRRAEQVASPREDVGQYITDLATTGVNSSMIGLPGIVSGGMRGLENQILDLMQGEGFSSEPWKAGIQEGLSPVMEARDRLPESDIIGAELIGGVSPKGPTSLLDDLALGATRTQLAPTVLQKFGTKPAKFAATGAIASGLEGYSAGETSFEDMVENGLFGAVASPLAQATIGDVALPWLAKRARSIGVFDDFGGAVDRLKDNVMSPEGYTLDEMLKSVEGGVPDRASVFDLDIGGPRRTKEETPRRFYNAMADLHFGEASDYKKNMPLFMKHQNEYKRTLSAVERYAQEADDQARSNVLTALGNPGSRADALYDTNAQLNQARKSMANMRRTKPNPDGSLPLGATEIDARSFISDLRKSALDNLGLESLSDDQSAGRVFDKFTDKLRLIEEEPAALGVALRPSQGTKTIGVPGEDVFEGANVARLLRARTSFAQDFLGANMNVTPSERAAAAAMLPAIDEAIAELTLGGDKLARDAFSKQMKMQEAYDMGNHFYTARSNDMAGNERFDKHYGDSLDKYLSSEDISEEEKDMFRAGFAKAIDEGMGNRGFLTEMKYFVGDYNTKPGGSPFFEQNEAGVRQLREIFGEDADAILDTYETGAPFAEYMRKLNALVDSKGGTTTVSPSQRAELIGTATDAVLQGRDAASFKDGPWQAGLAAMDYILKPSDRQKARALMKLLSAEGDEVRKYIQRGARQSGGLPIGVGAGLTMSSETALLGKEERKKEMTEREKEIEEYLKSLSE